MNKYFFAKPHRQEWLCHQKVLQGCAVRL